MGSSPGHQIVYGFQLSEEAEEDSNGVYDKLEELEKSWGNLPPGMEFTLSVGNYQGDNVDNRHILGFCLDYHTRQLVQDCDQKKIDIDKLYRDWVYMRGFLDSHPGLKDTLRELSDSEDAEPSFWSIGSYS